MCCRFSLSLYKEDLETRFNAWFEKGLSYQENRDYFPSQAAPVITNSDPQKIQLFSFGLLPKWSKNRVPNVRAETVSEKFGLSKRCIIPVTAFFEWHEKKLYRITLSDEKPFSFAGICSENSFAIITTSPNSLLKKIHHRMPVILTPEEEDIWLQKGALNLLDAFPAREMQAIRLSKH
ncbi:SOS response-associated peptidase [Patescibacteria group bacterium]|nr:SOS response-associated peptidase [Patescibacteria group bacterium]